MLISFILLGPVLARIVNDYEPQGPDQLALWKNGVITVLDQSIGDGLWKGDLNGKVGLFPADVSVIFFQDDHTHTHTLTHHHVIVFFSYSACEDNR